MIQQTTYKQSVKEKSRIEIWTNAIQKLTTLREEQRILKPNYIRRLWDYAFDEVIPRRNANIKPNELFIESWVDFSNNSYEIKKPQNLKVAYFCGPEPENDLEVMTSLGIRVENVWAIESDKSMYRFALKNVKNLYPTLKIFNGAISDLLKITSFKFDIIYLDFTAPLFSKQSKPLLTINSIFENDSLADLGILVINSSIPDPTDENIEFLAAYFRDHPFMESHILYGGGKNFYFTEGVEPNGFIDKKTYDAATAEKDDDYLEFLKKSPIYENAIRDNFSFAYSAFSSHYPIMVAGYIQPMWRVANNPALKRMLLKIDDVQIKSCINRMMSPAGFDLTEADEIQDKIKLSGAEVLESRTEFPIWNFILALKDSETPVCKYWYEQFTKKNGVVSLFESIQLYDLLRNAQYSYKDIISETLSASIEQVIAALPDAYGGVFCDVPMPHLWIELAINHLGNSYHVNTDQHWRAKYQAKEREMYLDMFVFDNCRALYNWLPMLNLYGQDMTSLERQIIVRSCMDAITKQNHHSSFFSYFGANLIGANTKRWSDFGQLAERIDLNKNL